MIEALIEKMDTPPPQDPPRKVPYKLYREIIDLYIKLQHKTLNVYIMETHVPRLEEANQIQNAELEICAAYSLFVSKVIYQTGLTNIAFDVNKQLPELTALPCNGMFGFVYCITNKILEKESIYKIGFVKFTNVPSTVSQLYNRLRSLSSQSSNPSRFCVKNLLCCFEPENVEKAIHSMLSVYKLNGGDMCGKEFYQLPLKKISDVFFIFAEFYNAHHFNQTLNISQLMKTPHVDPLNTDNAMRWNISIERFPIPSLKFQIS